MSLRALLVEDDASIATVLSAGLEDEGFAVDVRDSVAGRDGALAAGEYDVMLTDVVLLDGDGIETLGKVRDAFPELPVIILSAQNTLDTAVRATTRGSTRNWRIASAGTVGIASSIDSVRIRGESLSTPCGSVTPSVPPPYGPAPAPPGGTIRPLRVSTSAGVPPTYSSAITSPG